MKIKDVEISWFGHASFLISFGDKKIYIDPWKLPRGIAYGDYVLITHDHYDHFSIEDIDRVTTDDTILVGPAAIRDKLDNLHHSDLVAVKVGDEEDLEDFTLKIVPAYNVGKNFHPKEEGWIGYVLEVRGVKIYFAGDTDVIPEMKDIDVDVALLPVGGTYTMTAEEAAKATKKMKCTHAIPMHWGSIVGDRSDAEEFKKLADCKVTILDKR